MAETDDIVASLRAWAPLVASGYTVPAAGQVMENAATAITAQAAQIERLMRDEARLRKALAECAAYTGGHADGATVDFLMHVPENVRLHVERLTRDLRATQDDMDAERADAETFARHATEADRDFAKADARATAAERERDEARAEVERKDAALSILAEPANWRMGGLCDPNSGAFVGQAVAGRAALSDTTSKDG